MIIDIHGHLSPPEAAERFPMPPSLTDVDGMLAARAEAGIDLTIIGSPVGAGAMARVPGVDNYAQPRDRLRSFHAWMSGLIARFPDRLRGYVYANPFGDDDHLEGVRETLADPAFVGLITTSSVHGELLGSPRADSFFALAAGVGVPVLVHAPAEPVGTEQVDEIGFVEQIGRFGDVTMGMAMIAFAGWLDKYPDLRLIGATGGGAMALLPERLQAAALQRMYVDTSPFSPAHLSLNAEVLGPERMLFGTDSPPLAVPLAEQIRMIEKLPVDRASQQLILGGNAEALFDLRSRP
ncbi:amidohydrolase family protein [Streptomyces sp. NPDC001714]|uniref:amidohydrolase family protein n=1 Tax=Streptomyces sp. NPDC001714 TaxID=3364603 RepID=UPI0036A75537